MTCRQPGNVISLWNVKCVVLYTCVVCLDRDIHVYNKLNFRQRNVKLLLPMMTTVGNEMIELKLFFS